MANNYTEEANAQIVLALLKAHGIRKVIASPGATNVVMVASFQSDPFFEMYSAVDERSAAYMACGLAAESGEPVVISCTGATASRNYVPGLTEAYYRKLPVLAITSTQVLSRVGHLIPQVIDRSAIQNDIVNLSVTLPVVTGADERWDCEIKVNQAILSLNHRGGGPAHINIPTTYNQSYTAKELPACRVIHRLTVADHLPILPEGKVAIVVGSHRDMTPRLTDAIDRFCASRDAVVFCDHTSGYKGKYRVQFALVGCQRDFAAEECTPDIVIHIGEVTGDYYNGRCTGREVWRVSEDGEIRDTYRKLRYVFEMAEEAFFKHYAASDTPGVEQDDYLKTCVTELETLRAKIPELPFSNPWLASKMAHRLPENSTIHFGILNSLRSWNFFELPRSVRAASNVGGFGIDGGMSSLIGASLARPDQLYFGVIGDLAFFYDMNSIGNRHVGNNLRILLVNNGKGTEFRQYGHAAYQFGESADKFIAAAGHFGQKSPTLVKHYAEDLGFEYMQASDKDSFNACFERFLTPMAAGRSMIFEVFTDSDLESQALQRIMHIEETVKGKTRQYAKQLLGDKNVSLIRKVIQR